MRDETIKVIVAMICVTIPVSIAMINRIDGAILSLFVGVICTLAGYEIRRRRERGI